MLFRVRPAFGLSRGLFPRKEQNSSPPIRRIWGVPASQYDVPIPRTLGMGVLRTYYELIPLFVVTLFSLSLMGLSIVWAARNKVDTVFESHNRGNISRTMNLNTPTNHKLVLINQRYEPWPEMQKVLDKMVNAEKRLSIAAALAVSCYPK